MTPTAKLAQRRKSHELAMCKLRVDLQTEMTDELIKVRDYLKEQLAPDEFPNAHTLNTVQSSVLL